MRKFIALSAMFLATTFAANAQDAKKEPPKSPRVTAKSDIAEISYGQPSKRGRVIFGELVPYGQVWRTGANMSTDLTVHEDVLFGGKELKKGTYAIFTVPGPETWTIIVNSKPGQRGASEYEANKDKNVIEVTAPVTKSTSVEEKFTISFEPGNLVFSWDDVVVKVPFAKK
jgi:hypothetical protein